MSVSIPPAPPAASDYELERQSVELLRNAHDRILKEVSKVIVGQHQVIEEMLITLLSGGHGLITGAPGLAKTLLIKSLAQVFSLSFQRIQFTPDLMPSDITGTEILEDSAQGRKLVFHKGPIFANMILADEINRTPPKTQAALLEAMQEHQVTVAGQCYKLAEPFFVLATQNPIEMEGTYPLPEAQLDRFMLNVVINYLSEDEEVAVVTQTTSIKPEPIEAVFSGEDLIRCQEVILRVPIADDVVRYAVRLVAATRPKSKDAPDFVNEWVNWGAGTRASQYLVLGAKTRAILDGRAHVNFDDIKSLARPVMRHRLQLNYRAEAEGVTMDQLIDRLVQSVPQKAAVTRK